MPVDQFQDALRAQVEGVRSVVAEGQKRIPIVIRGDDGIRAIRPVSPTCNCARPMARWRVSATWRGWSARRDR